MKMRNKRGPKIEPRGTPDMSSRRECTIGYIINEDEKQESPKIEPRGTPETACELADILPPTSASYWLDM